MDRTFDIYSEIKASIHYDELQAYYKSIQQQMAICSCSQLIDTHAHAQTKIPGIIQSHFLQRGSKPFVFIICLN
ncbi:MAG: hypothetical protein JNM95_13310 [Chitinophagaceae bacterium]|nr:hypothetical protein [Chitinophagaceae bacterium]